MRDTDVRLIEGTGSPSGRYAVAWGIPSVPRLDKYNGGTLPSKKIRNYLVEKRGLRIVSMLPLHTRDCPFGTELNWIGCDGSTKHFRYKIGGDYWSLPDDHPSNCAVKTYWNRTEEWGIVYYESKWWYDAIYLCHRTPTEFTITEIGDSVEDFIRAHVRKKHPVFYDATYRRDPRDPVVAVNNITLHPPYITLRVEAFIPKHYTPLSFLADLRLRMRPHLKGYATVIDGLRELPPRKPYGRDDW